eukprot:TRINITY_DN3014_c0_g1_i7.p1 TRINITY_DN3014_c0_g1~~TRINITY_DN3014_c0_g1_i7.p1  ORF type:complete len:426 (-),score=96.64 TRINITY_DN3014_c0_g1_i7:1475-2752(-)
MTPNSTRIQVMKRIPLLETGFNTTVPMEESDLPELRVSAINQSSVNLFQQLGVWEKMLRVTNFDRMKVWDSVNGAKIEFDSQNSEHLGYIIENRVILSALYERIKELKLVDIFAPHSVSSLHFNTPNNDPHQNFGDFVTVKLNDGAEIVSRLVVGADGGKSVVKTSLNVGSTGYSYNQKGVVAVLSHAPIQSSVAYQCFLPSGPIALLPLHDCHSSIVWSTSPSHADYLLAIDDEAFLTEIVSAFSGGQQNTTPFSPFGFMSSTTRHSYPIDMPPLTKVVGKRGAFPLKLDHVSSYIGNRLALVGDSAHVVHPLAGQGVNLGIADTVSLTKSILRALEAGLDIGSVFALSAYEKEQKIKNTAMIASLDIIKRLFANQLTPIVALRGLGISLTNNFSPLKNVAKKIAAGMDLDINGLNLRNNKAAP